MNCYNETEAQKSLLLYEISIIFLYLHIKTAVCILSFLFTQTMPLFYKREDVLNNNSISKIAILKKNKWAY